jgi:hypothetical protein
MARNCNKGRHRCLLCTRRCKTAEALREHVRDKHGDRDSRGSLVALADDLFGDMPDGAFFAASYSIGLLPELVMARTMAT